MQEMRQVGVLALQLDFLLPLQVLESNNGFYLGTFHPEEGPITRESEEYFRDRTKAEKALETGSWTQRQQA